MCVHVTHVKVEDHTVDEGVAVGPRLIQRQAPKHMQAHDGEDEPEERKERADGAKGAHALVQYLRARTTQHA